MFQQDQQHPLRIAVIGLGLIGGSMGLALKKYTCHHVYGYDIDPQTLEQAHAAGAMDDILALEDLSRCDLVLVALYPMQTVAFVTEHLHRLPKGCMVVDLCGIKQYPVEQLSPLCAEHGVVFVGGHPMAGRECWGFSGADGDLFCKASMILTPDEHTPQGALDALTPLFTAIGFGQVTVTTPANHDRMIAFTSQLAHLVSSAYIKSPCAQTHTGFSAGSYKDLTRVAKLNAPMWTELFVQNKSALLEELDTLLVHLGEYRDALVAGDAERMYQLLEDGRRIKEGLQ